MNFTDGPDEIAWKRAWAIAFAQKTLVLLGDMRNILNLNKRILIFAYGGEKII